MTDETDNEQKNPYGFPPSDRRVLNLRDVHDPEVREAIEAILTAKWPEEGKAFNDECE